MFAWERFTVSTGIAIGEPGDLPALFGGNNTGLSEADLLSAGDLLPMDHPERDDYINQGFRLVEIAEPAYVPEAVTQLQFRRALRHFGLYDAVVAYVATQSAETIEAFDYASMVRRDSPSLNAGADALLEGAGQSTLDAVFIYAAGVVE